MVETLKLWIERCEYKNNITTIACVNTQDEANMLDYKNIHNCLVLGNNDRKGVCYPCNKLCEEMFINNIGKIPFNDNDIIVFASDDMEPPTQWDKLITDKLKGKHGALFVNDSYQDKIVMEYPCISLPIMTYSTFKKLNYTIYSDQYYHLYSDAELYLNLKEMDLLIDAKEIKFEHKHWSNNNRKPDEHDQSYYINMQHDKLIWESRRRMILEDRLTRY
jgi:hypothetical protein